jgi:hypothetical protein
MKKFLPLLLLLFILLPVWCMGATYHVSPLGSNTSPYDTWAKAANLPSTAVSAGNGAAGPHTVKIYPGEYTDSFALGANWANGSIIGVSAHGETTVNKSETVIIDNGDADDNIDTTAVVGNVTIKGLTLKVGGAYKALKAAAIADSWLVYGNSFIAKPTHTESLISLGNASNLLFTRNKTRSVLDPGDHAVMRLDGLTSGIIAYNDMQGPAHFGIWTPGTSTGNLNIYDNVIEAMSIPIYQAGSGTMTVTNNVGIGGLQTTASGTIRRDAGTVNATNNYLSGTPNAPSVYTYGTINTDTDNIKGGDIKPRSWGRTGYIMIRVDDAINLNYARSVEAMLTARGLKGCFVVDQAAWNTANNSILRGMVSTGTMEIGSHSYSHSDLNLTGNAFSITKTGKTVNIDRTTDTITVSDTVTVTGYKAKTLTAIRSELTAGGATVGALATNLSGSTLGESLADSSGAKDSPYTTQLLIDTTGTTGYFKVEITDPKAWLADTVINGAGNVTDPQTGATYVANTFASPFNVYNANAAVAIRTAGYTNAGSTSTQTLWSYNLFRHQSLAYTAVIGADVNTTKNYMRSICSVLAQQGGAIMIYAHSEAEISTTDANGWAAILDTIAEFGSNVVVTSPQLFATTIKTSPWTYTAGTGISTRTYTTYSDFRLKAGSPAINAGTDVGLTTDFLGKPIRGVPDIGAYEFQSVGGGLGMGIIYGF